MHYHIIRQLYQITDTLYLEELHYEIKAKAIRRAGTQLRRLASVYRNLARPRKTHKPLSMVGT